jgi:hypothetical protein
MEAHHRILSRFALHDPDALPTHVDMGKLGAAYKALENYEFVLRRRRHIQM